MSDTSEHPSAAGDKVLLVDDDPSMLRLLSRWLAGAGYRVRATGIGGVTRMQELLNDLLAESRYANRGASGGSLLESRLLNSHYSD